MKLVYNRSYTYVLPMLDWWDSRFLLNTQLRGCFIGDVNHPELDNHIFVLYKFTGARWFTSFEHVLQDTDHFVTSYDPDKSHVMFVYDVPEHQQYNYDMIKQSKYSQLKETHKKRVVTFHGAEAAKKPIAVMYKHESMYADWENKLNEGLPSNMHVRIPRDQEATTALNMADEVYHEKLKIYDAMESSQEAFLRQEGEDE